MAFKFTELSIPEVILIEPQVFGDERGYFSETYKRSEFEKAGIHLEFVQTNHSRSKKGVLRGLHFQNEPNAQEKLVRSIVGEIFDVAVDIRKGSPTYGKWVGEILSAENKKMLYVPIGFAHGFYVISDEAEMLYKCTAEYAPESESGIIWSDSTISIDWPVKNPIIADKDKTMKTLEETENHFTYHE
jgi:dTDP-4-dehydrorhamnose 3,5-epimerase